MRSLQKRKSQTAPRRSVTVNVLRRMRPFFDMRRHDHRCLWAMFCLAVTLLLRIGEAVPNSASAPFIIRRRDWCRLLGATEHGIFLRRSKCDVERKGILLRCPSSPDAKVCAVAAMDEYISRSTVSIPLDGPIFIKSTGLPLVRDDCIVAVQQAAELAGLGAEGWNGISFRKGGALSLALGGVPERLIKSLGRWSSDCFLRYIALTDLEVNSAARSAAGTGGEAAAEWAQSFSQGALG